MDGDIEKSCNVCASSKGKDSALFMLLLLRLLPERLHWRLLMPDTPSERV